MSSSSHASSPSDVESQRQSITLPHDVQQRVRMLKAPGRPHSAPPVGQGYVENYVPPSEPMPAFPDVPGHGPSRYNPAMRQDIIEHITRAYDVDHDLQERLDWMLMHGIVDEHGAFEAAERAGARLRPIITSPPRTSPTVMRSIGVQMHQDASAPEPPIS